MHCRITGTGSYLPEKVVTNAELATVVDTSDEWIHSRTGIRQRHIADDAETNSDMALAASRRALEAAGIGADEIDLIIVATTTPDMIFPSTACFLQAKLGVHGIPAFDVQAVCTGFVYGLSIAEKFIRAGGVCHALVVGSEIYSRILDWDDRGTCVLFGDGAGAVVLSASDEPGILTTHLHADGTQAGMLQVPGGAARGAVWGEPFLRMDGNSVFKFAVKVLEEVVDEALAATGMAKSDIDWLIPHQANVRIMQATARKLGLPMDKVVVTVDRHGNTSAASIPLALDVAVRDGRIQTGDVVVLEGVGGGFTWGAVLLRW